MVLAWLLVPVHVSLEGVTINWACLGAGATPAFTHELESMVFAVFVGGVLVKKSSGCTPAMQRRLARRVYGLLVLLAAALAVVYWVADLPALAVPASAHDVHGPVVAPGRRRARLAPVAQVGGPAPRVNEVTESSIDYACIA